MWLNSKREHQNKCMNGASLFLRLKVIQSATYLLLCNVPFSVSLEKGKLKSGQENETFCKATEIVDK